MRCRSWVAVTGLLCALLTGERSTVAETATAASGFNPVAPVRVLDTRLGSGGPLRGGGTLVLDLSARLPGAATAVVLNVTGTDVTANTFLTLFPHGAARPVSSTLNLAVGETRPNQATIALSADRVVDIYNNAGATHVVVDVAGYYAAGGGALFTSVPPTRVLDTRQSAPVGPGGTVTLDFTGRIAPAATAVTFTLTGAEATHTTFVTAWPTGAPRPTASNLNLESGGTRANLVTVALGADRKVTLYNNAGTAHLIADAAGFHAPGIGAGFVPLSPRRILDTRTGLGRGGVVGPLASGGQVDVPLASPVPPDAAGVLLNVTAVDAVAPSFVTVWSPDQREDRPNTSNLNVVPGKAVAAGVAVPVGAVRAFRAFAHQSLNLVADLSGVFVFTGTPCAEDCVVAWGANRGGATGTGRAASLLTDPEKVGLTGAKTLGGGGQYAVTTVGKVLAWGDNSYGQLGAGWTGGWSPVPVAVRGLDQVTAVVGGESGALALRVDGTVWSWGIAFAAPGPPAGSSATPTRVGGLAGARRIAMNEGTGYAVLTDGSVWAWGFNTEGALGVGPGTTHTATPVRVPGLTDVEDLVAANGSVFATRRDGTVWAWGSNQGGKLGTGQGCAATGCHIATPTPVPELTGVRVIRPGVDHAHALTAANTVLSWGRDWGGQLGTGQSCLAPDTCAAATPVPVPGLTDVTGVAASYGSGFAVKSDGTVWAWGVNGIGQLGTGPACAPEGDRCVVRSPAQVRNVTGARQLTADLRGTVVALVA
ncbi:RCC1 domain-containing protein [Actinokineospora iranica]|uniref:Alpha-tubulin suppressor n=1 Tax=Actinokineospora iranica TaxID=1271860 RepID=A0A1G6P3Q0_9PSEU|nr:hypothetical protein [Actinokineospora iranica]SDC74802.1 Alpha-tubulin suppressor [Actinokineospora iranica]